MREGGCLKERQRKREIREHWKGRSRTDAGREGKREGEKRGMENLNEGVIEVRKDGRR